MTDGGSNAPVGAQTTGWKRWLGYGAVALVIAAIIWLFTLMPPPLAAFLRGVLKLPSMF